MKVQSHPWEVYLNQFRNKQVSRHFADNFKGEKK